MPAIYTIGHSTRTFEEFVHLLHTFDIALLADIRTVPKSRRNPQFGQDSLRGTLPHEGIEYVHIPALGGLRHPHKDSPNMAWQNDSFRGYADYMQSPEFARAVDDLIALAADRKVAIMCAEAVPWRCHRSLVADALLVRGIDVRHIMSERAARPHTLTRFARVDGLRITYPAEQTA